MRRRTQHLVDRSPLDDAPEIHHRHVLRQIIDNGKVVRDEKISQPKIVLQRLEQVENLRLHRHVERRSRLVADDQLRLHSERTGNGNALPLPARELMRITLCGRRIKPDLLQQSRNGRRFICG